MVQDVNAPYDEYFDKNRKDPPTKATHTKREDDNTHTNAVKTNQVSRPPIAVAMRNMRRITRTEAEARAKQ